VRLSLPLRILLVHLAFTVGAGAVATYFIWDTFSAYARRVEREIATLPVELPLQPLVNEVAGAYLRRLDSSVPEVRQAVKERVSEGIDSLLRAVPNIESLLIVDPEFRIQYASSQEALDLGFTRPEDRQFLSSAEMVRRHLEVGSRRVTEVAWPILDVPTGDGPPPRRLGALLIRYRADPDLVAFRPYVRLEPISWKDLALPAVLFLAATWVGGVLVVALSGVPVRRLERALEDFKARDFRGGFDADRLGLGGDLAAAVRTIHELGGRIEALDAKEREREALLSSLSQSLEDGMLALGPHGAPVAWNPAALRLLGPADGTGAGGPEEQPRIREGMRRNPALLDVAQEAEPAGAARELELVRADGTTTPVQVTRMPFEARPGRSGTLLLLRDLAALRQVETHLVEAGRYASLAHLAASLAHEIRNPLHSIGLNAGVVEQYLGGSPGEGARRAMAESLATIQDETRRLAGLLNNYLGLVRPSLQEAPVDLLELGRRVQALLDYTARRSGVRIVVEGEEGLPPVRGIADRLQQAILNLVLNAIQAMPEGGTVRLRTVTTGGLVRLEVSDTGPGLPPELEEHVFDVRVTTKPEGTGLGLPLVRRIAESHGGSVWFRSAPGKGAVFTLVLPAASSEV
jgi:signal transduction histidine kinase